VKKQVLHLLNTNLDQAFSDFTADAFEGRHRL
jgi:hypothetical protein